MKKSRFSMRKKDVRRQAAVEHTNRSTDGHTLPTRG
jgi:hypothetical protein